MSMSILAAAKELKRFIDIQQKGAMIDPVLKHEVRDTETYKLASSAIRSTEAELSLELGYLAKRP